MKIFVCSDGVSKDGENFESALCLPVEQRAKIHAMLDDWLNHAHLITEEHEKNAREDEDHYAFMFSVQRCRIHE